MYKSDKAIKILFIFSLSVFFLFILKTDLPAENFEAAPVNIQTSLFLKLLVFNKDISQDDKVSVYVIGNPDFAAEMKKEIGTKIGKATLSDVAEGVNLPSQKPSVIYLGDISKLDEIIRYTRENKLLSITGIPDLVSKGISLGVGISDGKPKVLLNMSASKEEDIPWNPAILKISTIFK